MNKALDFFGKFLRKLGLDDVIDFQIIGDWEKDMLLLRLRQHTNPPIVDRLRGEIIIEYRIGKLIKQSEMDDFIFEEILPRKEKSNE